MANNKVFAKITSKPQRSLKETLLYNKKGETRIFLFLAFLIPFIIMWAMFSIYEVHPFGDKQILVTDLWHQYFPFFRIEHEKLKNADSLLYSWDTGLGTNFLSVMSYYAASPLNLLVVIFPMESSRDALTLFLTIKIGCAGLFFAMFLRKIFNKNDISITAFSTMYALCSYIMGYYWNLIWIDTVALLPLVVLGTIMLVKEGKYKLYSVSLALSLVANFYIGLFTCIFTVMVFIAASVIKWQGIKGTFKRLGQMTGATLIGAGMGAFILIPAFMALQLTNSVDNQFPKIISFYESWLTMISNMTGFYEPTTKEGLPNFYCGMFAVVLLGAFLVNRKIKIREKIITVIYLAFIIVSCNMNVLNYMWHGFHFTNMIPYRFSFLFSFILIAAAYRIYTVIAEDIHIVDVFALAVAALAIAAVSFTVKEEFSFITSLIVCFVYVVIMLAYERKLFSRNILNYVIFGVCTVEMGVNAYYGVTAVTTTTYSAYPKNDKLASELIESIEEKDDDFYRMEFTTNYTINDPALYGYKGVSQFSSTANVNVTKFLEELGLNASASGNRYYYNQSTPVINMFLNLKYIIAHDEYSGDMLYLDSYDSRGTVKAYKNNLYLPIGFVAEETILDYSGESDVQIENQNELFRLATGLDGDVFTRVEIKDVGHKGLYVSKSAYGKYKYQYAVSDDGNDDCYLKFNYTVPEDGPVYAVCYFENTSGFKVKRNDQFMHSFGKQKYANLLAVGTYKAGDVITFYSDVDKDESGSGKMFVYQANEELLREGYEKLNQGGIEVLNYTDTSIEGEFTAENDGVLYTSIPYDSGWKTYIDGEEAEIVSLKGAVNCVKVTAGTHSIKLKYSPPGFVSGTVITAASIMAFAAVWFLEKKIIKRKNVVSDRVEVQDAES